MGKLLDKAGARCNRKSVIMQTPQTRPRSGENISPSCEKTITQDQKANTDLSPLPLSRDPALANPVTHRFDIEFMLQMMQNIVTDRAVVAQADQCHSLSR